MAIQAFFYVRHGGGVADAQIIVRAEGDAGYRGDFLGFEQAGAELRRLEAELRDVREKIKRSLAVHATDAGDADELFPRVGAAPGVFGQPALEMILRPGERRDRALLREARRIAGAAARRLLLDLRELQGHICDRRRARGR